MAHTSVRVVAFGTSKAGLATVGYQLVNSNGTNNGSRLTTGVVELSGGAYGAPISLPDGFRGFVKWDTGEGTPVYASEGINPETDENPDVKTSTRSSHSATDVWAAGTRTLTTAIAAVTPPPVVTGDTVNVTRGDTIVLPFTDLGSLVGRSKLWLTVKAGSEDEDSEAVLQIEESAGLVRLNGAVATTSDGTTSVTDAPTGDVSFTLKPAASALLPLSNGLSYDVQVLISGVVTTLTQGVFVVRRDTTRATS